APRASASPSTAAAVTSQWLMYHLTPSPTGDDTGEPSFASLKSAWTTGVLDGLVYGEPLVDDGSVFVATENNSLYAFDARSGAQRWHVGAGAPRSSNFP